MHTPANLVGSENRWKIHQVRAPVWTEAKEPVPRPVRDPLGQPNERCSIDLISDDAERGQNALGTAHDTSAVGWAHAEREAPGDSIRK